MTIPTLDPVSRSREYVLYNAALRAEVVHGWLFDGQSHRTLDQDVLGLDPVESRGYQSMGILHHLGLKKDFRALFAGQTLAYAVDALSNDAQDFGRILEHLDTSLTRPTQNLASLKREEQAELSAAGVDSSENRAKRIAAAVAKPERMRVYSYTYRRNADIVAEALIRAGGVCEKCSSPAPFVRASDGTPFLEVHHVTPLSGGGEDRLENVMALCPNCHREVHFGES